MNNNNFDKNNTKENIIDNTDREVRIYRKNQGALMIAGLGIIMLNAWNLVKMFLYLTVDWEYYVGVMSQSFTNDILVAESVITIIITVIICFIYYKIGMFSINVARGKKGRKIYFPLIVIYLIFSFFSNILDLFVLGRLETRIMGTLAEICLNILSELLLATILYSSFSIYRFEKKNLNNIRKG